MRFRFRAAGLLALAVVAITCSESTTGPRSAAPGNLARGHLVMVPEFSPAALRAYSALVAAGTDITNIHVVLTAADGSTRDTVIAFPVGQDTAHIEIDVPLGSVGQQFTALVELRAADGTVLFSGTLVLTALPSGQPVPTPPKVTVSYSGPGKSTKAVSMAPPDTTVTGSPTVVYKATAIDSAGKPVSNLLVSFASSDPTVATVTATGGATASVHALGKRGSAVISATTPTGITGSSKLTVVPPASKLVVISGGAQTGAAGAALPLPFVVEAQAADNLPVPGTTITFRPVTAGGSVAQTTPLTADAAGRAAMTLTLGTAGGTYQYEASSPALTPVTVSETATPPAAVALAVVSGDLQTDSVGRTLALPLVVKATDQFGAVVGGATVTWTRVSGAGALGAASTTTASDGTSSTTYTLGSVVGTDVVRATLAGVATPAGAVSFTEKAISRGAGTIIIVSGGGQSGPSGAVLVAPLVAKVTDVNGNPTPNQLVAWSASLNGATFNPATGATDAAGMVSTIVTLGTATGPVTISAVTGALSATTSATITVGAPATIAVTAGNNQTATVGSAVAVAPAVTLKDAANTPVPGVPVTFAIASGGGSATGTSAVTNAQGVATVGSWTLGTAAGPNTLTATAGALAATVSATAVAGTGSQLAFATAPPLTAASGAPLGPQPVIQLKDANGNIVSTSGVVITASVTSGSGVVTNASATTVAGGTATFSGLTITGTAGAYTLAFSAPGYTTLPSGTITVAAGAASTIAPSAGNNQSATVGTTVPVPPSVKVTDASNNPVAGAIVTFSVITAGAQISNATTTGTTVSVTTSASGIAALTSWTLGTVAQPYSVDASITGLTGSPVLFSATGVASTGSVLSFVTAPPLSVASGIALGPQPVIQLKDVNGNSVSTAGVVITASLFNGTGTLVNTTATTVTGGLATFSGLTISGAVGALTLQFTSPGYSALVSNTITVTAGAANSLALNAGNSQTAAAGAAVAVAPSVLVTDNAGNPVAGTVVTFTAVTVGSQVANASISGASVTVTTNAAGIAALTSWTLSPAAQSNTLTATAAVSTGSPVTFTATGVAGPAAKFSVTGLPLSITVGANIGSVTVQLVDAQNNPVAQAGVNVTGALTSQPGNVVNSGSQTTNAAGAIVFTVPPFNGLVGSGVLSFAASGFTTFTSPPIPIVTGAATRLVFTTQPGATAQNGVPLSPQPVVQVADAGGNPVSVAGVSVNVTAINGGSTIGGTSTVLTNANGSAAFTNLSDIGVPGPHGLSFDAAGLTSATFVVTLSAGPAATIALNGGNNQTTAVATAVPVPPSVKVVDASGNPVAGTVVQFTAITAGSTVSSASTTAAGVTVATNAAGIAQLTAWTLGSTVGTYTMDAAVSGLAGSPVTFTATATSAAGTVLVFTQAPSTSASSGVPLAVQPIVQLKDAFGNNVNLANVAISPSVVSGVAVVNNPTAFTNASGVATFSGIVISGPIGNVGLAFNASGYATLLASPIALGAGAAVSIAPNGGNNQTTTVATAVPVAPSVKVADSNGNPVAGTIVTFTTSNGATVTNASTTALSVTVTTNASGIAQLTAWTLGNNPGPFTMTATATGLAGSPVTFSATGVAGPAVALAFTVPPSTSASSGAALAIQPVVQLKDGLGNDVSQSTVSITASVVSGTGSLASATAVTNASGLATFSGLTITGTAGSIGLAFKATGTSTLLSAPITLGVGAAKIIAVNGGNNQSATQNTAVSIPPSVIVTDGGGNPVAGVVVTFDVVTGGGTLQNASTSGPSLTVTTNASGIAALTAFTTGSTLGANTFTATVTGLTNSPLTFTETATTGPPTQFVFVTSPSSTGQIGVPLSAQPALQMKDSAGNPVSASGFVVTANIFAGTGTLTGATATTDAFGLATFTNLTINGTAGGFTLTFTSPGYSGTGADIFMAPGNPAGAVFKTPAPATEVDGVAMSTAPVLQVVDGSGNAVPAAQGGQGLVFTASITSGSGSLTNNIQTTDVNGLATFTGLTITGTVGSFTLQFKSGSLVVSTAPISVTLGAAKNILVNSGAQSATAGFPTPIAPSVKVTDVGGNAVSGVAVFFQTITAGQQITDANTCCNNLTVITNASGIASLVSWTLSTNVQSDTITATSTGVPGGLARIIAVGVAQGVNFLSMSNTPLSSASGALLSPQPIIQLRGPAGGPLAQAGVPITAYLTTAQGTLAGTTTVTTNASGVATFTNLAITRTTGSPISITLRYGSTGYATVGVSINIP